MQKSNCFAQRLKRSAAFADPAVCPIQQNSLAVFLRKRRKCFQPANREKAVQRRIPELEELRKFGALFRTWIEIQRRGNGCGNIQIQRGGPAFSARKKSFTNTFQRAHLAGGEVHKENQSLTKCGRNFGVDQAGRDWAGDLGEGRFYLNLERPKSPGSNYSLFSGLPRNRLFAKSLSNKDCLAIAD